MKILILKEIYWICLLDDLFQITYIYLILYKNESIEYLMKTNLPFEEEKNWLKYILYFLNYDWNLFQTLFTYYFKYL